MSEVRSRGFGCGSLNLEFHRINLVLGAKLLKVVRTKTVNHA